jgi:hypothetical protein
MKFNIKNDHNFLSNLLREGSLDLEILLDSAPSTTAITAVFYLEFDNIVEITKQNQVQLDYKV